MNEHVVLSENKHSHLRLSPEKARLAFAQQPLVPVVVSEFLKLCIHFPIVIIKQAETGRFGCSALMGLDKNENLFLADSQWQGIYWPANIRRQPFQIGQDRERMVVCVNPKHAALSTEQGEPLFAKGEETACLIAAKSALAELVNNEELTQQFLQELDALSLLTPLQLEITSADGKPHKLSGLYSVDERKLTNLSADQLKRLQQAGYLSLIYTLLASHGHIYGLVKMKNGSSQTKAA